MQRDKWQVAGDKNRRSKRNETPVTCLPCRSVAKAGHLSRFTFHVSGFTLIELLVVISILGIMAGLTVPVLKNWSKSDATLGASRQLLDGVARARQLAISQRTTVYMVFVPPDFWNELTTAQTNTPAGMTAAINLCDKQFTGYTFVSLRSVGDQPGQGVPHYLAPWQTLPDNTFIATNKFIAPSQPPFNIPDYDPTVNIYGFNTNATFPFPTADALPRIPLPWIAFNYLGQLTVDGQTVAPLDEYIPIAKGSVLYARDPATKTFQFNPPEASENPPGNSTDISYSIVHIDRLTGRAVLEFHKMQ
jgi:prepilin-type N-terminal cleavage/methylation domain-containing protein